MEHLITTEFSLLCILFGGMCTAMELDRLIDDPGICYTVISDQILTEELQGTSRIPVEVRIRQAIPQYTHGYRIKWNNGRSHAGFPTSPRKACPITRLIVSLQMSVGYKYYET